MEASGYVYSESIDVLCTNGFFAWMSSHGRHAASSSYEDIIETLRYSGLWIG